MYLLYYYKSTNTDAEGAAEGDTQMLDNTWAKSVRGVLSLEVLSLLALLVQKYKY